jgi:ADP-dependent NAD(P)H-hydrate dehydratase / NAD(P)H-hydrate epimerase
MTTVRVTTAAQAAARDTAAIAAGTESFSLMLQAGTVSAAELLRTVPDRLARGVDVLVGSGNNGGDGYVVAAQLARLGVPVRVLVAAPPRTADAIHAERLAKRYLSADAIVALGGDVPDGAPHRGAVVDALLGTGASGPLRGAVAVGAAYCRAAFAANVPVFALDVPTGVDGTTGEVQAEHVRAHHTITFGTCKSGLLAARGACGRLVVADIGLGAHAALSDGAAMLATAAVMRAIVPPIAWDAHKGTRGRVLVIGGAEGMAGAAQLVARGALHSGAGLLRAVVHAESAKAMQTNVPAVVCANASALDELVHTWAHTVVLGPGLGRDDHARATVTHVLGACQRAGELRVVTTVRAHGSMAVGASARRAPALVIDADALMLLATPSGVARLRALSERTAVLLTPHAGECAVLADACDVPFSPQWRDPMARAAAARGVARSTGCTVLLKGAPTVCASPEGVVWCVPRGSAALATGGTGDVLAGVLAAILASARSAAEHDMPLVAHAALGAWVHGVAGERATHGGVVRGTSVDDVVAALGTAWAQLDTAVPLAPGVLAEVPPSRP